MKKKIYKIIPAKFITFITVLFVLSGCRDNITNVLPDYSANANQGISAMVERTDYTLETVHSSFFNESYDYFDYSFSIDVIFKDPSKRNEIKKLTIIDEKNSKGWEFYDKDIEKNYVDSIKGCRFKHLILQNSYYSGYGTDRFFKVKLVGYNNTTSTDYDFILKADFPFAPQIEYSWSDKNSLTIKTQQPFIKVPKSTVIYWLKNNNIIDRKTFSSTLDQGFLVTTIDNVPLDAESFYVEYNQEQNGYKTQAISKLAKLPTRVSPNTVFFKDNIKIEKAIFLEKSSQLAFSNSTDKKLYLMNFDGNTITKTVDLPGVPAVLHYSADSNKVYMALKNGGIYAYNIAADQVEYIYNCGRQVLELVMADSYLVLSVYNGELWTLNLKTRTALKQSSYYIYNGINDIVYNPVTQVLYGSPASSYSSELYRFTVNSATGQINDLTSKYSSLTGYMTLSPDGSKLATGNGYLFSCSKNSESDPLLLGTFVSSYTTMVFSQDSKKMIAIYPATYTYSGTVASDARLCVIDVTTLGENKNITLSGTPSFVFRRGTDILVVSKMTDTNVCILQRFTNNDVMGSLRYFNYNYLRQKYNQTELNK